MQEAPYIEGWLKAIGIGVTPTSMSDSQLTADIGNGQYDMFIWGWGVEPNPDFQMSVFTCGQRSTGTAPNYTPGWSDSFYCNPAYDKLYHQQQGLDGAARAVVIKKMEQMLYTDDPYSVLYYWNDTQAYRSDLFTGFAPQPDQVQRPVPVPGSLLVELPVHPPGRVEPVADRPQHRLPARARRGDQGRRPAGVNGGLIGGIAAAVVVLGAGAWLLARRRRTATADERE